MTRQIQYPWPSQKRVRVSDLDVSFFDSLAYHKIPVPEQHDWTDLDRILFGDSSPCYTKEMYDWVDLDRISCGDYYPCYTKDM